MTRRRRFLQTLGLSAGFGLAGCQGLLGEGDGTETTEITAERTATATQTATATPEPPRFTDSGTLYVEAADGPIGPEGFFDQGEVTESDGPDDRLELIVEEPEGLDPANPWRDPDAPTDGETVEHHLSTQELRKRYHFNQIYQLVDVGEWMNNREILREFPEKLDDDEWLQENIIEPYLTRHDVDTVPTDEIYQSEIYTGDGGFETRVEESGLPRLWEITANVALGGPSSTQDYIKTAALTAAEYHTADKETFTFHQKTLGGSHGLGFAITGATYNEEEQDAQETWGIETDPGEDNEVWPVDDTENYPNRENQRVSIEDPDPEGGAQAWERLGMTEAMSENVSTAFHGGEAFEEFLRDPDQDQGMKYIDAACLTAYINEQAHEDGALPEFEDAQVDVYPDRVEYELAS